MNIITVFAILFVYQINADSVSTEIPSNTTVHDGCYDKVVGHLAKGETTTVPGECQQASCGDNGVISVMSCGLLYVPRSCHPVPEDTSKPYPDCCAKVEC